MLWLEWESLRNKDHFAQLGGRKKTKKGKKKKNPHPSTNAFHGLTAGQNYMQSFNSEQIWENPAITQVKDNKKENSAKLSILGSRGGEKDC